MRRVLFTPGDYAELLGLYLGDGHIARLPRTQRLRISLDAKYTGIVDETEALLRRCFPANRVCRVSADRGRHVRINRREGVALMLEHVGPKA